MRKIVHILLAGLVLGLAGCGGDSDTLVNNDPAVLDPGAPVPPTLASLDAISSNPQIPSDGALPVTITAFVKDDANNFVEGQVVAFSADSGGIAVTQATTDANGTATASLSAAGDPTNRPITVTVTAGDLTDTVVVQVIGTQLEITGPDNLVQGDTTTYSIVLADAGGTGIAGETIDVASANGNTLAANTLTTDATGQAQVELTATQGGIDTLSASALGLTTNAVISVSDDSFLFTSPPSNTEIPLGTNRTVTVRWTQDGAPQAGQTVLFSTTRGSISPAASVVTNANGEASIVVTSTNAGPAVITAAAIGGPTTQLDLEFVATTPSTIEVQADPFTVAPNSQSQVTAVVRDADNNLVKNARVVFSLDDITSGSLSIGTALTNSQGRATTFYTAADTVSGNLGVVITATLEDDPLITDSVALTVARRELFVAIGSGNELSEPDTADYEVEYSIQVTDSEGNGVPNASVQLNVKSVKYSKGYWTLPIGASSWVPFVRATCDDEDDNGNGILDPGEFDENNNGTIEAGNIALVTPGEPITDESGKAVVRMIYGQVYGLWTQVKLEAKVAVQGTEFTEDLTFVLSVTDDDVDPDNSPPGVITPPDLAEVGFDAIFLASPWGYSDSCAEDL